MVKMDQFQFQQAIEQTLKDLGFVCDPWKEGKHWSNCEYAVIVTVWNDGTVDLAGLSNMTMKDIVGPMLDAMDEGEK